MYNPISFLYERLLERGIVQSPIPVHHLLLVLDETDLLTEQQGLERLRHFVRWCHRLKIAHVSVYVSLIREGMEQALVENARSQLERNLRRTLSKEDASVLIYGATSTTEPTYAPADADVRTITISLGLGGRRELMQVVKAIARAVELGELAPEEIDEKLIESELLFKSEPDLVIRSGATRLMDFLIWQSVYTEFYFTDMNWANFRKIDLLRAVRDFQLRERRFGR
jgi:undecaprenyl diphosphate synthase